MKKILKYIKELEVLEFHLFSIDYFLKSLTVDFFSCTFSLSYILDYSYRSLFRIFVNEDSLYIDILFIKFCIYEKNGREFYIK